MMRGKTMSGIARLAWVAVALTLFACGLGAAEPKKGGLKAGPLYQRGPALAYVDGDRLFHCRVYQRSVVRVVASSDERVPPDLCASPYLEGDKGKTEVVADARATQTLHALSRVTLVVAAV